MNNKLAREQLQKLKLDPNQSKFFIPKVSGVHLYEGGKYFIRLSYQALHPSAYSMLTINYNKGLVPTSEYYKADVSQVCDNLIKANCLAVDANKNPLNIIFNGWLDLNEIEVLEEL